ncbi:hypothetical protein DBR06_SOUSAS1310064 [Sousa chinensis]|uniref:Uncharacterized protein n=1 Tax=Sousa chinensis TaxID=103600 RepID=A0A484GYD9_SOUCH|nr:hypothetical protein DBR06_SOUSAS1310064 [Sousa chinensis]
MLKRNSFTPVFEKYFQ